MALAAAPFGFRPLKGAHQKTIKVALAASPGRAIGTGDVLIAGDSGATVLNANDDAPTAVLGVAAGPAEVGAAYIEAWDAFGGLFEVQTETVGSNWATEVTMAGELAKINGDIARDTTTLRSKQTLSTNGAGTVSIQYHAPIPGNVVGSASSYPIFVVRFLPAALISGA